MTYRKFYNLYDPNFLRDWRQDPDRIPLETLLNTDYYSDKIRWKERLNDIDKDENVVETGK